MYIRKSTRSHKGKTYTNYLLVESILTPKGPRIRKSPLTSGKGALQELVDGIHRAYCLSPLA